MNNTQEIANYLPEGTLMKGKRGIIMGVANNKSIAWGIAKSISMQGAEICLTYQGEMMKKRVEPLAEELGSALILSCDVTDSSSIDELAKTIKEKWGKIDFLVHAVAFSDKNELKGRYVDTTLNNFLNTMHISCFSFTDVIKRLESVMNDGCSLLTLSYHGAQKVMPHYNVMGIAKSALETSVQYLSCDLGKNNIRVNAISAGPIKTLAASGIGDFRYILKWNEYNSPLRRNTTIWDVGKAAIYILSDLSSGTTGEILYVDSGYHVVGMKQIDAPDIDKVQDE